MLAQEKEILYPKRVLKKLFPKLFMGNIMVSVTAMTLASCGGGSGGAALPTGTSPPDIGPVYDDPKILALERRSAGAVLINRWNTNLSGLGAGG